VLLKSDLSGQQTRLNLLNKSLNLAAALSVTQLLTLLALNLVTPYCAIHFLRRCSTYKTQRPESGLLNKSSCLALTLGVTKFITIIAVI
jgi:hypothetical protein